MEDHHGKKVGKVKVCDTCGFTHLDPVPSQGSVDALYKKGFYEKVKSEWLEESREDREWLDLTAEVELRRLMEHRWTRQGVLLDVGAGLGDFVRVARRYYDAVGLEPSDYACFVMKAANIPHWHGFFHSTQVTPGSVNVLRMAWYLEHSVTPKLDLKRAHELLEPDGLLSVTVPNDFSVIQSLVVDKTGKKDYWVDPTHINYFNLDTLRETIIQAGFDVLYAYASFPMEFFALMGLDYIQAGTVGRAVHTLRKELELNMAVTKDGIDLMRRLQSSWAYAGIGRDITVVARKR